MVDALEHRIIAERRKARPRMEELSSRIKECYYYGPKVKGWLERCIRCESVGEAGLFDVPPVIEPDSGSVVVDADGKEQIDLISGFSVNNLGICHPEVVEAIKQQAGKLIDYFDLPSPPRVELSQKLIKITPGDFLKKSYVGGIGGFPYAYCYRCFFDKEYPRCRLYCIRYLEKLWILGGQLLS